MSRSTTLAILLIAFVVTAGCAPPAGSASVDPANLRHFNPEVIFGDDTVAKLLPGEGEPIEPLEPIIPQTVADTPDSPRSFIIRYSKEVGFEPARASLNQRYGEWEILPGTWRVKDRGFSIVLSEESDAIHVTYVPIGSRAAKAPDRN